MKSGKNEKKNPPNVDPFKHMLPKKIIGVRITQNSFTVIVMRLVPKSIELILMISQRNSNVLLLNTICPALANSVDPDQLACEEANWSESALLNCH